MFLLSICDDLCHLWLFFSSLSKLVLHSYFYVMIRRSIYLVPALALSLTMYNCSTNSSNSKKEDEVVVTTEEETVIPEMEMTKEYITTFQIAQPERITIESFQKMSDQYDSTIVSKGAEVTDGPTIIRIMELVKALPDKGAIMKKLGDVPLLEVRLTYSDKVLYFDYYSESIKTSDTSFYA